MPNWRFIANETKIVTVDGKTYTFEPLCVPPLPSPPCQGLVHVLTFQAALLRGQAQRLALALRELHPAGEGGQGGPLTFH